MDIPSPHHLRDLTETLKVLSRVHQYNRWIYDQFRLTLGHSILEIGAGVGNITTLLKEKQGRHVYATDVSPIYLEYLHNLFRDTPNVTVLYHDASQIFTPTPGMPKIDSIVCINVLEHIEDDVSALKAMHASLPMGGYLHLLVPSHTWLYGTIDRAIGHIRRYSHRELQNKIIQVGFVPIRFKAFNPVGIIGWLLQGKVLKRTFLDPLQTQWFDQMVPLIRHLPFQVNKHIGLSWVLTALKQDSTMETKPSGSVQGPK